MIKREHLDHYPTTSKKQMKKHKKKFKEIRLE